MDNSARLVTIFGGSGFIGAQVVQAMARRGYRVRVAVRRPDLAGHVRPLGNVGQVVPVQANIRVKSSVERAVAGADAVINLVGIGFERGPQRFGAVHVEGARHVAEAARAAGAETLVHMSALGADAGSPSLYARTKRQGEEAVADAFPGAVIIRPSVTFGPDDGFFNLMGKLARWFPVLPLIGGKTRFQPVYVANVAEAFAIAATGNVRPARIYELGGPEVLTYRELMQKVLHETGRNKPLLPLPPAVGKLLALPFAVLPFAPLVTADQIELLQVDNVVSDAARDERRTLAAFGIEPTPMDAVLSSYLWRFRRNGQFERHAA